MSTRGGLGLVAYVVLHLLVAGEDANLADVCEMELYLNINVERADSVCNHQCFIFEYGH